MKMNLTQLSIAYLDSFGFEASGSIFWVKAFVIEKLVNIYFKGVVNVNFSRDLLDLDCRDLDVIEVTHELRQTTANDFKYHQYIVDDSNDLPELNLVTFHGTCIIAIICEELEIV